MTPCIPWPGNHLTNGRPITSGGRWTYAYRAVYELACGPLAPGLEVHHACHNPGCVNLTHLEALTRAEHRKRHPEPWGANAHPPKTHCKRGHAFDAENTLTRTKPSGGPERVCRACSRIKALAHYHARKKP